MCPEIELRKLSQTFPSTAVRICRGPLLLRNEAQPELGFVKIQYPSLSSRENLEFNPERELPDAASSGVTGASLGNLSEMAVSQIVPRIIEVYVVDDVCEATVELQSKSLREPEALGESQGEVNRLRANERPHASVAKAANRRVCAIKLYSGEILSCGEAGAGEYVRVKPMLGGRVGNVGLAEQVGPIKAIMGVLGGIILQERSQERSGLS